MEECLYCHAEVEPSESIPALDDDQGWTQLAAQHAPDCEWVRTRALQIRDQD
jgi:hypothetical protein